MSSTDISPPASKQSVDDERITTLKKRLKDTKEDNLKFGITIITIFGILCCSSILAFNDMIGQRNSLEIKYNKTIEAFKNLEMEHEILKSRYRIATKETQTAATFTVLDAIAYLLTIDIRNTFLISFSIIFSVISSIAIGILFVFKQKKKRH